MNGIFDILFKEVVSFPTICIYNLCIFASMVPQFKKIVNFKQLEEHKNYSCKLENEQNI